MGINKKLKDYTDIIWDWNGTLLNDVKLCADIMNNLLRKRSLPTISFNRYRKIFTFPVKDYYIKAGHNFVRESFKKIGKDFIDQYEKRKFECDLFPFVTNVLKELQSQNVRQHLLSAYKQENLIEITNSYSVADYFSSILGLDHIYADGKIELGKKLLSAIHKDRVNKNVLLIGDTIHDFDVATEIGADCILISSGHQHAEKMMDLEIPVFNNLEELHKLLKQQRN